MPDLDAFVAAHRGEWDRLALLSRRRRLDGAEADELVALYQQASTHLSIVRSASPDPALVSRLSTLVARARSAVTGPQVPFWSDAAFFLQVTFPVAVWRARWWAGGAFAGSLAVAVLLGARVGADPRLQTQLLGGDAAVRRLINQEFAGYYTQYAAGSFAAAVWTNNAWVAALCVALGITGVGVVYVLWQNAANVGVIGGIMLAHGRGEEFFGLILPHGMLELTAVFVAAGAGLKLFWSWVEPGPRPRGQALAQEGRAMVSVAMGLVGVLAVSGLVEAFVTPSALPTWARIGVGAVAWVAFAAYVAGLGRPAARAGQTGDLRTGQGADTRPVAG